MTSNGQTETLILGSLRSVADGVMIHIEDVYDTDIADLWSALTDPSRLGRWAADIAGNLRVGGEFRATFTSGWEGTGRVNACEAPQRLQLTLIPDDADEPRTEVEALLSSEGERTRLVIEARGIPASQLAGYGAGWQVHLEDLTAHIAGHEPCDFGVRWRELRTLYADLAAGVG